MRAALRTDDADASSRMRSFWVPPPETTALVIDLAAYRASR